MIIITIKQQQQQQQTHSFKAAKGERRRRKEKRKKKKKKEKKALFSGIFSLSRPVNPLWKVLWCKFMVKADKRDLNSIIYIYVEH